MVFELRPYQHLISLALIVSFFLFNFIDRDISDLIFVVIFLFSITLALYNFNTDYLKIDKNEYLFLRTFVLFFLIILFYYFYHGSDINNLDNYSRFLLIIPVYFYFRKVALNYKFIYYVVVLCAFVSFIHGLHDIYSHGYYRATAASNLSITYGNLNMTLFVILCVLYNYRKAYSLNRYIIITGLVFSLIAWYLSLTRGSIIGLLFCFLYFLYLYRSNLSLSKILLILLIPLTIFALPNNDRMKILANDINIILNTPSQSQMLTKSTQERIFYYTTSIKIISSHPFDGIGLNKNKFTEYLDLENNKNKSKIEIRSHSHNDFLSLGVKVGILGIFALIYFYYSCILFFRKNYGLSSIINMYSDLGVVVCLSQLGFMMTQTQLHHHQATIFFLFFVILISSQLSYLRKDNLQ